MPKPETRDQAEVAAQNDQERADALVREYLRSCLTVLGDDPLLTSRVWCEAGKSLAVVLLTLPPPEEGSVILSDCERDVVTLLVALPEPASAEKIRDTLEDEHIGIWSLRTVKRALKRLMGEDIKLVANSKKRPRGYYLIGKRMTLFRKPAVGTESDTVPANTSGNTKRREDTEAA
jgi:hypothetical protein